MITNGEFRAAMEYLSHDIDLNGYKMYKGGEFEEIVFYCVERGCTILEGYERAASYFVYRFTDGFYGEYGHDPLVESLLYSIDIVCDGVNEEWANAVSRLGVELIRVQEVVAQMADANSPQLEHFIGKRDAIRKMYEEEYFRGNEGAIGDARPDKKCPEFELPCHVRHLPFSNPVNAGAGADIQDDSVSSTTNEPEGEPVNTTALPVNLGRDRVVLAELDLILDESPDEDPVVGEPPVPVREHVRRVKANTARERKAKDSFRPRKRFRTNILINRIGQDIHDVASNSMDREALSVPANGGRAGYNGHDVG